MEGVFRSLLLQSFQTRDVFAMSLLKAIGVNRMIGLTAIALSVAATNFMVRADALVDGALTAGSLDRPESDGAFRHLRALQEIAEANGGNRAAGKPGYDRSADYVANQLKAA